MKAKKMIVPILMGVLMAFAILPMTAGKAYAEDYELWVGGTHVKSDNALGIPGVGGGTASYDAESKTLTLNGVTIPDDSFMGIPTGILSRIPDLKIEVHGENQLSGHAVGIHSTGSITITGDGRLEAEGSVNGIVSGGGVTIKDVTVTATGTGSDGIGIEAGGEVKIEGRSKVQAKGANAIYSANKITLGGGHAITEPEGLRVSDDGKYIVDQYGNKATSVTIERVVEMNGDGTEDSPFQIKTYADLKEFASIVNGDHLKAPQNTAACAELENTIIAKNDPSDAEYASDWTPIGTPSNPYIGHFDGDNHIIKGLSNEGRIGVSNTSCQGLFGYIGKQGDTVKGEVKNVGLEGGKIIGRSEVGGVAGYNNGGTITNCHNTGAVSGDYNVGGVAGYNYDGEITNGYNTGAVSGESNYVGGVAGDNYGGEITNCYNTGAVSGTGFYVGGMAGQNKIATIKYCYNTGAISGHSSVGGVTGYNYGGTTVNSYNTGAVSGNGYVGGVAGFNDRNLGGYIPSLPGTIVNCYNTGVVSGNGYVGGVVGKKEDGIVTNCYFDNTFSIVPKAIGDKVNEDTVKGLETSQMTGTAALDNNNMLFSFADGEKNPWTVKANGKDADSRTYYEYYPHLKGFAYDDSKKAADWPGKLIASAEWSDDAASYPYTASPQGPAVTKVTISQKPVKVPGDKTGLYSRKTDSGWDALTAAPTDPGSYKLTIKDPKDGDKVIEEIVYIILKKKNSSYSNDYNVKYQVQKKIAGGGTEWSDIDSKDIVDVGNYKAVIELTSGNVLEEKEFQIAKAPLTITTAPTASAITYGHKLNDSKLTGGVAKDGDAEVAGTFTWDEPDTIPAVSDSDLTEYDVTFTPDDTVIYDPQPMKVTVPVNKAKLTITAISYSLSYNGEMQGPGDKTYNDAAEIAEVVKVEGLQGSDALTSVEVDGQGQTPGGYPLIPNAAAVNKDGTGTGNYKIKYVNGTLTIEKVKPKITTAPKASAITYGQTLKDSSLTGGLVKDGDTVVPGTFKWDNTDTAPAVSDSNKTEYDVTFTPTDTANYEPAKARVTVTVNKAATEVTTAPKASAITYGQTLEASSLSGGIAKAGNTEVAGTFAWDKPKTAPSLSDSNKTKYDVTFTPTDTANYGPAKTKVTVTVNKATTEVTTPPTASAITYGQTLKDSSLTGGTCKAGNTEVAGTFTWDKPNTAPEVSDSDKTEYDVTFTPSDTANYGPAACTATLTVNKADITPSVSIEGWTYGSTSNTPTVEGNPGGGDVAFLYKGADEPDTAYTDKVPTDAGPYTVRAEVAETANYNAGEATLDFTISPADMQVTSAGYNGTYDGAAHSITVNAPDGADIEYSRDGGKTYSAEKPAYTDAGEYAVPFRVRLENYNEYSGTENVLIDRAPNSVTVSIEGWTYGKPANIPTVTAEFGADKAKPAYSDRPDGIYKAGCPDQAGKWYVKATVPETKNYAEGVSKPVAFEIAQAAVTIKADDKSSKYGEALKELTYKVSGGYVEGDDLGVTLSTDAKKDKAGDYAIKVAWNGNPNYTATLTDGTYTVGKKPAPGPKPKPHVNKAKARIQLNAGLKAISSGDKVTASWGKVTGASSYVVYATYCDQKKFNKIKTVSGKTTSLDIRKLAGKKFNTKKNLKVYVVAYTKVNGKKVKQARSITVHAPGSKNSKRTNVIGVKVRKDKYTLKEGQTRKIKAKRVLQDPDKKPLLHTAKFRYASSNEKVATVNKKGKITAVGKGKCTVYVYAVSGVSKKIKVTVK